MAADVAIVQSATMMVFMAFATNARNIILGEHTNISVYQLFRFRIYLVLPLSVLAYYLSSSIIELSIQIVICLIVRRGLEWIAELQISKAEMDGDSVYAYRFTILQIISLFFLLIASCMSSDGFFTYALFFWAVSPGILLFSFIRDMSRLSSSKNMDWKSFVPHMGSSWVIAVSTYVFRVFIILLAGKAVGGLLFSAFAIGGMINSVYTYALGPTLSAKFANATHNKERIFTFCLVFTLIVTGILLTLFGWWKTGISSYAYYTIAVGWSLIGGGIMLVAQRRRIHILQNQKNSVFIQDVLANILIIATVPFAYILMGESALTVLFLWNSIITLAFYILPSVTSDRVLQTQNNSSLNPDNSYLQCDAIQALILFFLVFPIFIQFSGSMVFADNAMNYLSEGKLSRLPLPVSLIACFVGIAVLVRYNKVQLATSVLFCFFITMLFSVFINSPANGSEELNKLVLVIQYILPVFALILGQSYLQPENIYLRFESVFLYILLLIVPFEVVATIMQYGHGYLTPYLYVFSIYQHLQYVPVIFIGLYSLCIYSLIDSRLLRNLMLFLSPFMGVYIIFSNSLLALSVLILLIISLFIFLLFSRKHVIWMSFLILLLMVSILFTFSSSPSSFQKKYHSFFPEISQTDNNHKMESNKDEVVNVNDRLIYWKIYWKGISKNIHTVLFGNTKMIDRELAPSAHNYYLDLLYNFGIISLLPIFYLLFVTLKIIYQDRRKIIYAADFLALTVLVVFFIFVDNMLKVGFRQPYPGIIMFFLWGVLINKIVSIKKTPHHN